MLADIKTAKIILFFIIKGTKKMANLFEQLAQKTEQLKKQRQEKYLKFHDCYTALLKSVSLIESEFDGELVNQIKLEYTPLLKSDKEGCLLVNGCGCELASFDKFSFYSINEDSLKKIISLLDGVTKFSYEDVNTITDIESLKLYLGDICKIISVNALARTNQLQTAQVDALTEKGFIFDNVVSYKTEVIKNKVRDDKYSFKQLNKFLSANTKVDVDKDTLLADLGL